MPTTPTEIFSLLTEILRDVFDNDDLVATPGTTAADVEGWNSLGNVRLFLAIEGEFGIRFSAGEMSGLKNMGELADAILSKSSK